MKRVILFLVFFVVLISVTKANDLSIEELIKKISESTEAERPSLMNQLSRMYLRNDLEQAEDWAQKANLLASKLNQTEQIAIAKKQLGVVAFYHRSFEKSERYYLEAKKLFEKEGNRIEVSNIYNNLALIQYEHLNYQQAIDLHRKALEIREAENQTSLIIASLSNLGNGYKAMGNTKEAYAHYRRAFDINKMVQPENLNIALLSNLAIIESERGNQIEAKSLYLEAITIAKAQNDVRQQINSFNNLGNLYFKLGDHEKAIEVFNDAIDLTKKFPGGVLEGSLLLNVGNIYQQTGQTVMALSFYQQALFTTNSSNDQRLAIHALINIGMMQERLSQYDSAKYYFELTIAQSKKLDNPELMTMAFNAYGNFLKKRGDLNLAKKYLKEALELASANQLANETAKASMNLGSIAFLQNNLNEARAYYNQSLILNRQQKYLYQQMENLIGLAQVEEKANNPLKALYFYKSYMQLNDSLFNTQKQEQISAIEGKLNLKLKEEELQNQTLIIERQKNVLRQGRERLINIIVVGFLVILITIILFSRNKLKQAKEKAILEQKQLETEYRLLRSQMNPHFLFNALNSIQSFISENNSMQAETFLSKFARLMRYYLESSSKSAITLLEEIEGLQLNIELERLRMNNSFDFIIEIDENINASDVEIAPMLAQPFVENAIKHGLRTKKDPGLLKLSYKLEKNYIRCSIEDNGIGRQAAAGKPKNGSHDSKGIEITRKRLMHLHGKNYHDQMMKIQDLLDEKGNPAGTLVEFVFPFN